MTTMSSAVAMQMTVNVMRGILAWLLFNATALSILFALGFGWEFLPDKNPCANSSLLIAIGCCLAVFFALNMHRTLIAMPQKYVEWMAVTLVPTIAVFCLLASSAGTIVKYDGERETTSIQMVCK